MFETRSLVLVLILVLSAPAALNAQTMRQQQQRETSQRQVEMRLYEVRQKLRSLNIKTSELEENSRREFNRLTAELREKQEMVGRKMGAMRAADSRNWESCKAQANAAVDELYSVYNRLQSLEK